ncbi:hypothetical protein [Actinocorallia sp. A-T 12471]|uniref:hypothetical protein n=1 Tax=Actinocorallia sp. A-T 12471 TaxID=3089813 RepID=UPI0029CE7E5C|nr:hypothetical protein [Actinocorallia sp. A-T 12471]MDX6738609.1 hypothetical protein [Actinocorallia sp. A-T 12471]
MALMLILDSIPTARDIWEGRTEQANAPLTPDEVEQLNDYIDRRGGIAADMRRRRA